LSDKVAQLCCVSDIGLTLLRFKSDPDDIWQEVNTGMHHRRSQRGWPIAVHNGSWKKLTTVLAV